MNSGYLYRPCAPLKLQELFDLIKNMGSPAWRIQEKIDDIEFKMVNSEWLEGFPTSLWPQGRAFSSRTEIRWWIVDHGIYDILLLSETRINLSRDTWNETTMEISIPYLIYLWGERKTTDKYWIETRIPHEIYYPIEDEWQKRKSKYAAIKAYNYSDNSVVKLTRFFGLELINEPQGGIHV